MSSMVNITSHIDLMIIWIENHDRPLKNSDTPIFDRIGIRTCLSSSNLYFPNKRRWTVACFYFPHIMSIFRKAVSVLVSLHYYVSHRKIKQQGAGMWVHLIVDRTTRKLMRHSYLIGLRTYMKLYISLTIKEGNIML